MFPCLVPMSLAGPVAEPRHREKSDSNTLVACSPDRERGRGRETARTASSPRAGASHVPPSPSAAGNEFHAAAPLRAGEYAMTRTNVLNTTTVHYLDLIGNGKTYRVPPYQRDYAWAEEEWEDLWNDVLDLRECVDARHYMGALVVKGDSDREFTIIDGQQRLATISVLSLAIIAKLHRIADHDIDRERNRERATELRNRFIGEKDPASLIESSRLNLSRADDAFYQDYLVQLRSPQNPRGLTQSNALLWKCFRYFSEQLDALNDVQENGEVLARILSESVARRLLFILITVEDDLNAYTVFETLNARGLELTTADLLKNYLFSKVRVQADLDASQRRWHALIATVTAERFSEFLRYHLLCEQPKIRKERLFKLIRDRIDTPHQVFDLLDALEKRAELYAALADANHEYWQERPEARPYVRDLILFRTRQVTPVLFAAWERFSRDDFVRVLKLVGVVSFRYQVSGRNPNALERVYHEAAKAILDGNASRPRAVFAHLRPVYVDDGAFAGNFAVHSLNPRGRKKLLKYILCRLEDDANGVERQRDAETDPASIEHILPQNPSGAWTDTFTATEIQAAVERIGNATLLEPAVNRDIGSASYTEKRSAYARSSYLLTRQVSAMAPEEWTFALLEKRQQLLAERATQVWRSDFV